jgi:hypothetical protein
VDDGPNRRRQLIRVAWAAAAAVGLYVLGAYLVLPALWSHYEHQPGLAARPLVTVTPQGIPGDPLNVGLVGSREEIMRAMTAARWHPADPITLKSSLEIGLSVVLARPYQDAPVSTLLYEGRRQDLAFEQPVGASAAHRHHVRLWLVLATGVEARGVWLGAASFDRSVGLSHTTGQITHHIDPDLDAERAFVIDSLARAGALSRIYQVSGIGPTLAGRNGGGDRYFTDGEIVVGVLRPAVDAGMPPPERLPSAPAIALTTRLWSHLVALARSLGLLPEAQGRRTDEQALSKQRHNREAAFRAASML